MSDRAMVIVHCEGRAAGLDFQTEQCPDAWGMGGWRPLGVSPLLLSLPGKEEVQRGPRVIIVLPPYEGCTAFKTGEIHSVNSIHTFNYHLDKGHTNG